MAMQNAAEGINYIEACEDAGGAEAEYATAFAEGIRTVLNGQRESFSFGYPHHSPEGQRWFMGRVNRFPGEGPLRIVIVHENVTELKQAEINIKKLAYYDILTDLPNRHLLNDRLRQAIIKAERNRQKIALMYLDLDQFKVINDTLGHYIGDKLIKAVADRLLRFLRKSDTVARMGGDEFVIILNQVKATEYVTGVAKKILDNLSPPFELDGQEVFITTSIGIALFPDDGNDGDRLLKNANTAMYQAKEMGRNNFQFFSAEMNVRAEERLSMETNLRHALERNEFLLYYQPWLNLETGRISGLEALLRWQHPKGGLVPPDRFIQLAEETGLIIPIGEWVLQTACSQIKLLQRSGFHCLRMAINLAGRQLKKYNLVKAVADTLSKAGLEPSCLELELTEGSIMENVEETTSIMHAIKRMGVYLSVDDFGTGYSSLSYLKRFPIDKLKIDSTFVNGIPNDPGNSGITLAIIAMSRSLKLEVVAEGVETAEQLDFLRKHGCDNIQGFLVSHPLPAWELPAFLARYNRPGQ